MTMHRWILDRLIRGIVARSAVTGAALVASALLWAPAAVMAQEHEPGEHGLHLFDAADFGIDAQAVTFTKDIAPILARSCVQCHRTGGAAPMPYSSYQEVRRFSRRIYEKTAIRDRMGAMPPWYVEKDIGIQHYKQDPSLTDEELATIQAWVDNGAPEGDPADLIVDLDPRSEDGWRIEPDLIVSSAEVLVEGGAPDWWGEIESVPIGLTEDRYVASVEIKEVNDVDNRSGDDGRQTVGRRYVFHHMIWSTRVIDDGQDTGQFADRDETDVGWPVHEVGRNPDMFAPEAGRLLRAGSSVVSNSIHVHSNGVDTRAHLEIGFRFHPKGYEPEYPRARLGLGNGVDIDIRGNEKDQELHAYRTLNEHTKIVTFEPHLHAPGARMCLEAIWGYNVETLSCVGYDHNWVRGYAYADDAAPLLPKGTILHIVGYMDTTTDNINIADPRNWQGAGNRSVTNMFIDLGMRVSMTDEQFVREMAKRRESLNLTANDHVIGCPLCTVLPEEAEGEAAAEEGSR